MNLIIKVFTQFLISMISIILGPINSLIIEYLPGLDSVLSSIRQFFEWIVTFSNWVLSWLPFNPELYAFWILIIVFKLSVPILVDTLKLIVKWWHALAP